MQDLSAKKKSDKVGRDESARRRRQYLAGQLGLQEDGVNKNNFKRVVGMLTRETKVQKHELELIRTRKVMPLLTSHRRYDVDQQKYIGSPHGADKIDKSTHV